MDALDIANPKAWPASATRDLIRSWFTGRRGLIIIIGGIAIVAAGLYLSWSWLAAIGAAPIILSQAPCAAVCAIGACSMMKGNSSCAKGTAAPPAPSPGANSNPPAQ